MNVNQLKEFIKNISLDEAPGKCIHSYEGKIKINEKIQYLPNASNTNKIKFTSKYYLTIGQAEEPDREEPDETGYINPIYSWYYKLELQTNNKQTVLLSKYDIGTEDTPLETITEIILNDIKDYLKP